ncbi:VF530 family protein [Ferrimonas marina]|uniref:Uncharacterized conserved protein n=1 Tax=Ferrimonas marina TaxID=299255 RepID=A0A1M5RTT8_9GAMM|nr:VF530 family DNA-binding protein [Ferrimonas marina]SHH29727.1 Uncharacterized conserved protein [Ferrimonas marina]
MMADEMTDKINYQNNPLHGLSLKDLVTQLVEQYGFELLYAYLNLNCFRKLPTVDSSVKFLKKTEWARHKIENFYLYTYKNLPRPSSEQYALPPRDRIVPDHHQPGEPKELSFADAKLQRQKREEKAAEHRKHGGQQRGSGNRSNASRNTYSHGKSSNDRREKAKPSSSDDPWAAWR